MSADASGSSAREAALEAAGAAVRDARGTDRDAILAAQRILRDAEKAHADAVRRAEADVRRDPTDAAEASLTAARADRSGVAEARPLLDPVLRRLEEGEEVLDLAAGVSAGHDGVLVVTSRRVMFVAPRRTVDVPLSEVDAVRIGGRRFGARATIVAHGDRAVVSGLSRVRAAEIASLLVELTQGRTPD